MAAPETAQIGMVKSLKMAIPCQKHVTIGWGSIPREEGASAKAIEEYTVMQREPW
jgi:hypothetical protein